MFSFQLAANWGQLAKVRGIVCFHLSPFEQKAFAGSITKGVPNTIRRFKENFWRVVPSFLISYCIYDGVEKEAKRMMRKDPADYECDE